MNARHVNRSQNQKKFQEAVNNCAHTLVVLVLCIFSTCRAFRPDEVFLSRCPFCQVFICTRVCLPQGPLSLCLRSFLRCDTLYALFRDCLATVILTTVTVITSTVGSGATVPTIREKLRWSSVVKMTRRTVLEHIRLVAVFSNNNKSGRIKRLCLMIRRESQIGGVRHMYQVITLKSRSGLGDGPHLLMQLKILVNPFDLPLRCRCS